MSGEDLTIEELRERHAAQIDSLLAENAKLRKALEGEIDPSLLPGPRPEPRGAVAAAKALIPLRWHGYLGRARRRLTGR
jgi:hypothetical protein